jgi:hypothetical protein
MEQNGTPVLGFEPRSEAPQASRIIQCSGTGVVPEPEATPHGHCVGPIDLRLAIGAGLLKVGLSRFSGSAVLKEPRDSDGRLRMGRN